MASELIGKEIARLCVEIDEAAARRDWEAVRRRAEDVLLLDAEHLDARLLFALADRRLSEAVARDEVGNGRERLEAVKAQFPNAYAPWSAEEEQQLSLMYQAGDDVDSISRALRRAPGGVRSRLIRLGLLAP
jgi:hypothetical protein